jgi:hypothetical protein
MNFKLQGKKCLLFRTVLVFSNVSEQFMTPSRRKTRTEAILREKGIPFLPSLPCIESEEDTALRTPEEVGIRMLCLFCVIGSAYDPSDRSYRQYLERFELWEHLTPEELAFMSNPSPTRESMVNFTWRSEALFLLAWAVRLFETLPLPTHQTDNEEIIDRFTNFEKSPWPFVQGLTLRPKSEILDASDLLYRLHWAARSAESQEQPPPGGLDPGVVHEWHYAINWITKYEDLDWDEIVTDT